MAGPAPNPVVSEIRRLLYLGHSVSQVAVVTSLAADVIAAQYAVLQPAFAAPVLDTVLAALVLNVSERRVRDFCKEGRLGSRVGARFVVSRAQMLAFLQRPRAQGRAGAALKHAGAKRRSRAS